MSESYFFCGIGGSGMMPLAMILRAKGATVSGSDRALDQGRTAAKFDDLRVRGIELFAQDGSGPRLGQTLVASAAVEDSVPDIAAAIRLGLPRITRADLLARLFNDAPIGIAVGGTSGKSTTTGMIGWILHATGRDPTVMNGAVMKNFVSADAPFASALVGQGDMFVTEVDESDGSITLFRPAIAVLNNVSLDHKSMDELRQLFGDFIAGADTVVANLDDAETAALARTRAPERTIGFGFDRSDATLSASNLAPEPFGIAFDLREGGETVRVRLRVPGRHNVENALAALGAARACGVPLAEAARAIEGFEGLRRRFERIGEANGVTVIDDFGHNPEKVAATLSALRAFPGRLLVMFQPHGYGPLAQMGGELAAAFAAHLGVDDILLMPDPVYFGGTANRSVGSGDIVAKVVAAGRRSEHIASREACGERLLELARPGDRIVVMGARDDTLSQFAEGLLTRL